MVASVCCLVVGGLSRMQGQPQVCLRAEERAEESRADEEEAAAAARLARLAQLATPPLAAKAAKFGASTSSFVPAPSSALAARMWLKRIWRPPVYDDLILIER